MVGVLSLAEISRGAVAAQQVDKALSERMAKLHDDAQKEQAAWRDVQQQLVSQRASLNAEQIRAKERDLQERVTNAQRQFRDRNRIIQEAAQYARAQIERTLRSVVIQVSESHGINLVLHQEQVVLNYPAFDITQQVVEQLNKVLPSVVVPPDGVPVAKMPGAVPVAQGQPTPGQPTPADADARRSRRPADAGPPASRTRRHSLAHRGPPPRPLRPPRLPPPRRRRPRRRPARARRRRARRSIPDRWSGRRSPGIRASSSATGPHSLAAVAEAAQGEAPPRRVRFAGVAPLQSAGPEEVSFLDNKRYLPALTGTRAGAVIIHPDLAAKVPEGCVAIVTSEPYEGWARVAALFHPLPPVAPGIHPSAVVDPTAAIEPSAEIGPLAVIGRARGDRCALPDRSAGGDRRRGRPRL